MNKIISILLLLFVSFGVKAQFINVTNSGSATTLQQALGGYKGKLGLIMPDVITDTTTANTMALSHYAGSLLLTSSGGYKVWWRSLNPDMWNLFATGSIPSTFNPIQGYGLLLTGTYPNITFTADTTKLISFTDTLKTYGTLTRAKGDALYAQSGSGVTSIIAGTDITITGSTGNVTINDKSTLNSVTGRGNTTLNTITIGGYTVNGASQQFTGSTGIAQWYGGSNGAGVELMQVDAVSDKVKHYSDIWVGRTAGNFNSTEVAHIDNSGNARFQGTFNAGSLPTGLSSDSIVTILNTSVRKVPVSQFATQYWQRASTILSPLTAGDAIRTSGIIQSTDGTFYSQLGNGTVQAGVSGGNSTSLGSATHSFIQGSTQLDLKSRNLVTGNHSVFFQDKDYTTADSAVVAAIVTSPFQGTSFITSVASNASVSVTGNINAGTLSATSYSGKVFHNSVNDAVGTYYVPVVSGNTSGNYTQEISSSSPILNASNGNIEVIGNIVGDMGLHLNYRQVTSTYSITVTGDFFVDCIGTFTVTLPNGAVVANRFIFVVKNSGTGIITINASGPGTIDGQSSVTLNNQYSSYIFQGDGSNGWKIIGSYVTGSAATNYWQRSTTTVSPATLGDAITTTGVVAAGNITSTNDVSIHGITVGEGAGSQRSNTVVGYKALPSNTTGDYNVAIGDSAMFNAITVSRSVAIGHRALYAVSQSSTGVVYQSDNTAVGYKVMSFLDPTGHASNNTGVGSEALANVQYGLNNTAVGLWALKQLDSGFENSAGGVQSFGVNTTGSYNAGWGMASGNANTTGQFNSFFGYQGGYRNTIGSHNATFGNAAMAFNTTGSYNTALGDAALQYLGSGSKNVAIGYDAQIADSTADGQLSIQNIIYGAGNTSGGSTNISTGSISIGKKNATSGIKLDVAGTIGASGMSISGAITAMSLSATITTAAQANITSLGTLSALTVSGTSSLADINTSGRVRVNGYSGGATFGINGSAGAFAQQISGSSTVGASFGLVVDAGDNSSDITLLVRDKTSSTTYLSIKGDGTITFGTPPILPGYTVAGLPAGTIGMHAYVTDALAPGFLTIVVGGGTVKTPVFYNGTNWVAF